YLAASDVCLCLRWPTALETSAWWLRCMAAARATIVSDLAHTADVPDAVARAGHEWWKANHTMDAMAEDYRRILDRAVTCPAPKVSDLPAHFVDDYSDAARAIAIQYGISWP